MATQRLYVGIDDTDQVDWDVGTGKFSRRLLADLTEEFQLEPHGSVRQQLLVDDRVPYTTHNSAACLRFDVDSKAVRQRVIEFCGDRLSKRCAPNADPGLCVGFADEVPQAVVEWGEKAKTDVLESSTAREIADRSELFLDDYGGTGDGVVGALAAVGCTAEGNQGRFVAFGDIRTWEEQVSVGTLRDSGIAIIGPTGAEIPDGTVLTKGWLRPQLRNGRPVLPVVQDDGHYIPANLSERGGH